MLDDELFLDGLVLEMRSFTLNLKQLLFNAAEL